MSRNKKKCKPLKPALSATEKKLLETKTRQIEKAMTEPTKMKIFLKIKNETRWKLHRPDVLQKAIQKCMLTKEPKKKRSKHKTKSNNNNLEHLNNENRQFQPFLFGSAAVQQQSKNTAQSTKNENENEKQVNYKKNDRKRTFSEMDANDNNANTNKPETVYTDTTEGRRTLLKHTNNPTAKQHLDEIIKDKLAQKHGKKRRKINITANHSIDPIIAAGNTSWEVIFPQESLSDVGGLSQIYNKLDDLLVSLQCDIWPVLGVSPPRSVLLHGPPGSGKTLLAHALAGEAEVGLIKVSAPELVAGLSGQSEAKIRSLFESGLANEPCIIFIDEIDVIAGKRENAQRQMESRIVAQLLTCLDDMAREAMTKKVMFVAATNRPDCIDNALRRGDRFDYELTMGIPDKTARCKILRIITQNMRLEEDFDYDAIAEETNGFVGADLKALTKTAGIVGVKRILKQLDPFHSVADGDDQKKESAEPQIPAYKRIVLNEVQLRGQYILETDFSEALKTVEPSSRREGFATIPDVCWDDIGALSHIRNELTLKITARIRYKEMFNKLQIDDPCGILLFGPPGCGKTLLAKAIAAASGASFISIKGPELLNKYVGESERAIRTVFRRARSSPPCIVFFDELDALAPKRESGGFDVGGSSNNVSSRVVNQLLTELDGVKDRGEIFVIGATNRFDIIDTALIRPGRLGTKIYVGLPDVNGRYEILKAHTRNKVLRKDVDLELIARSKKCDRFSGADLALLVTEASMNVIKKKLNYNNEGNVAREEDENDLSLSMNDFLTALDMVKPSITQIQAREYEKMAMMSY